MPDDSLVDFALVALREEGHWELGALPHRAAIAGLLARVVEGGK